MHDDIYKISLFYTQSYTHYSYTLLLINILVMRDAVGFAVMPRTELLNPVAGDGHFFRRQGQDNASVSGAIEALKSKQRE